MTKVFTVTEILDNPPNFTQEQEDKAVEYIRKKAPDWSRWIWYFDPKSQKYMAARFELVSYSKIWKLDLTEAIK